MTMFQSNNTILTTKNIFQTVIFKNHELFTVLPSTIYFALLCYGCYSLGPPSDQSDHSICYYYIYRVM